MLVESKKTPSNPAVRAPVTEVYVLLIRAGLQLGCAVLAQERFTRPRVVIVGI
jgi:hypothetical protein